MKDAEWRKNFIISYPYLGYLFQEIYEYKYYCEQVLIQSEDAKKKLDLYVKEEIAKYGPNGYDFSEEFHSIETIFPKIQIESAFITGYAIFESLVNKICLRIKKDQIIPTKVGKYIDGSKVFLEEIKDTNIKKKVTAAFSSSEFDFINNVIRPIRNSIIHASGDLENEKPSDALKLRKIIDNCDFITIKKGNYPTEYETIVLSQGILAKSAKSYSEFLYKLCTRE